MSHAFKREVDKGTLPGATVLVARKGQIGWVDAIGRQSPTAFAALGHETLFPHFSFAQPKAGVENNAKPDLVPAKRQMTVQDLLRHTSGLTYDHTGNSLVQQLYRESRLRSRKITNAEHAVMLA